MENGWDSEKYLMFEKERTLSQIDDSMKDEFKKDIMEEIRQNYPLQKNGKVIFDFPRLFCVINRG